MRIGTAAVALALVLAACKPAESADPSGTHACVDATKRVRASATWEKTDRGNVIRIHVEALESAPQVRIDGEPSIAKSGQGTLFPQHVTARDVIVDILPATLTAHVRILVPNQTCDGAAARSGSITVACTWHGDPSLHPAIETTLGSTGVDD